jgi:hypothetical protein
VAVTTNPVGSVGGPSARVSNVMEQDMRRARLRNPARPDPCNVIVN